MAHAVLSPPLDSVYDYPVCRWVRLLRERNAQMLENAERLGIRYSEAHAQHAVDFFHNLLRHGKGPYLGQPFQLLHWQEHDIIRPAFGWLRRSADGKRWVRLTREIYISVGKKNGKSPTAGGILLYCFAGEGKRGVHCFTAATKRDQARVIHEDAVNMVRQSPELMQYITVPPKAQKKDNLSIGFIGGVPYFCKCEPFGRDWSGEDGKLAYCITLDEYHQHPDDEMYNFALNAGGGFDEPLLVVTTTAGGDVTSPCYELHERCIAVLEGQIEDYRLLPFIATIDEGDDPYDERVWVKANPSLGTAKKIDEIRAVAERARDNPSKLNAFLRFQMNKWTQTIEAAIDLNVWKQGAALRDGETPMQWRERQLFELAGRTCFGAFDLSATSDTTTNVLLFPPDDDVAPYIVLPWIFLPEENILELEHETKQPLRDWARQGFLTLTPGARVDYAFVREKILELREQFTIQEMAADPTFAGQLITELQDQHGMVITALHAGYKDMALPTAEYVDRLIPQHRIAHGDNPVFNWQAGNLSVKIDAEGRKRPIKTYRIKNARGGIVEIKRKKIDAHVAAIMALNRAQLVPVETSVYSMCRAEMGGCGHPLSQHADDGDGKCLMPDCKCKKAVSGIRLI